MSKLLNSILDKVSENNNEYRNILRTLNASLDEKATTFVGDVVQASNYTIDFSNTLNEAKDKLVDSISKIIESYVIKDLRSVETVNEQFVEKINDKLEGANITSKEEKESFTNNLNNLLNNKYLEIVKIKRVDFTNENGENGEVESIISDFKTYLNNNATFDMDALDKLIANYKNDLYYLISNALKQISDLYLNNFVSEVTSALNSVIDIDSENIYEGYNDNSKEETNDLEDINIPPLPTLDEISAQDYLTPTLDNIQEPQLDISVPKIDEIDASSSDEINSPLPLVNEEKETDVTPIKIEAQEPVEIKDEVTSLPKRSYDVEEILKIAKSPIVAQDNDEVKDDMYIKVDPIVRENDQDALESEYNERQIVEEMIKRLTNRLKKIDERRNKYNEEKAKLQEDEAFVNDLIESAENKKIELDNFEKELNDKEKELENKQKELDKKINDVMPFANAVLNTEES